MNGNKREETRRQENKCEKEEPKEKGMRTRRDSRGDGGGAG